MKIIICGSISASREILKVKDYLIKAGHQVEIPEGVKNRCLRKRINVNSSEKAADKIKYGLIRNYYQKIKDSDIVLIVNPEKNGVKGYIGGNTLIEMAFTHVLNKKLYCLYPLPKMPYTSELLAMQPIILDNDLTKLV